MKFFMFRAVGCAMLVCAVTFLTTITGNNNSFGGNLNAIQIGDLEICDNGVQSPPTNPCSHATPILNVVCEGFTMTTWTPAPVGFANVVVVDDTWNCWDYGVGPLDMHCAGQGEKDVVDDDGCILSITIQPIILP